MKFIFKIIKRWPQLKMLSLGAICIATIIIFYFDALRSSGHIVFGDIDFGFFLEGYTHRVLGTWNELWSNPNFFNLSRLPIVVPLYSLGMLLNISPSLFLKGFIFLLLFSAGFFQFLLLVKILETSVNKYTLNLSSKAIFFIAIAGGIFYALNPWTIMRIQHLYLLVGYALLPLSLRFAITLTDSDIPKKSKKISLINFVFYKRFSELSNKRIWIAIFGLAFSWTLSTAAIHYLFFTFFLFMSWAAFRFFQLALQLRATAMLAITLRFVMVGIIFLMLSSYFTFPQIIATISSGISPNNINSIDTVDMFSRNASWENILFLSSYWWTMFDLNQLEWTFYAGAIFFVVMALGVSIFNSQNQYIRFFFVWTIALILLASGTKSQATTFNLWLIFDSPLAGIVGFLFRDPNKLIGLVAFGYSILFSLNLAYIYALLLRLKKRRAKLIVALESIFSDKRHFNIWPIFIGSMLPIVCLAFWAYLDPFDKHFLKNFYKPVSPPQHYLDTNNWLKNNESDHKTLWLPRNEMIVSPNQPFTSTTWNEGKPTSGIDIFSTRTKTYNTTEGSTPYMSNFYQFIDDSLRHEKSLKIYDYLQALNIKKVIYHRDVSGLEEIDDQSIKTLKKQSTLNKFGKIGSTFFFELQKPSNYFSLYPQAIISTGGLSLTNLYGDLPFFDFKKYAVWFTNTQTNHQMFKHAAEGDVLNFRFFKDLTLSQTKDEHLLVPFDDVNYSDAFIRWAKNRVISPDWKWHLQHLGIDNQIWDFDFGKGIIFTYAPEMIDIEPYENPFELGTNFISTDMLKNRNKNFFSSEDEALLKVDFAQDGGYDQTPFLKGQINEGSLKHWKVATSDFLEIKPEMGYTFGFTISGQNTNQIHGKIKYYNALDEEIEVSYVSAPRQAESFNLIRFSGNFVTPADAKKIKIQFWTKRKPKQKLFWWAHQIEIKELQNYMRPNTVELKKAIKKPGKYKIFSRVFYNQHGGKMAFRVNGEERVLITKTPGINQFFWEEIGEFDFKYGVTNIEIENLEGFNAVNLIAVIPKQDYIQYQEKAREVLGKTKSLYLFDTNQDALVEGNLQSKTFSHKYSNGKGIFHDSGTLTMTFDIEEPGVHSLFVNTKIGPNYKNSHAMRLHVLTEGGQSLYHRNINLDSALTSQRFLSAGQFDFEPGRYQIKILTDQTEEPILNTPSIHEFKYNEEFGEFKTSLGLERDKTATDCCYCESIEPSDLIVNKTELGVKADIAKGCSCWWVISASNIGEVKPNTEYYLSFETKALLAKQYHAKLFFLSELKGEISNVHIKDFFDADKNRNWKKTERIIKTPPHTKYVQLHFLSRKNPYAQSKIEVKDLSLKAYENLVLTDTIAIVEGEHKNFETFFNAPDLDPSTNFQKTGSLKKTLDIKFKLPQKRSIIQVAESYSPLWKMSYQQSDLEIVDQLSVVNQFVLHTPRKTTDLALDLHFRPQKYYQLGLLISGTALAISLLITLLLFRAYSKAPSRRCERKQKHQD